MQTVTILLILIIWSNSRVLPCGPHPSFLANVHYTLILLALHVSAQLLWTHTALSPWFLFVALTCEVCSGSLSFLSISLCNAEKYWDSPEPCLPGSPGPTESKALKSYNSISHEIPSPAMQFICEKGNEVCSRDPALCIAEEVVNKRGEDGLPGEKHCLWSLQRVVSSRGKEMHTEIKDMS